MALVSKDRALVLLGSALVAASSAAALASWRASRLLERRLSERPTGADGVGEVSTRSSMLAAADRAALNADGRAAAALYEAALAAPELSREERLAARLGLARAYGSLGDARRVRDALGVALAHAGTPRGPEDLIAAAELAVRSRAPLESRRLWYAALALEGAAPDEKTRKALARAALRIADSHRSQATAPSDAGAADRPAGPQSWLTSLGDVDAHAAPTVAVSTVAEGAQLVTVRAERADSLQALALLAERSGRKLVLPEARDAPLPGALTADLRARPFEEVARILAGVAGLEVLELTRDTLELEAPVLDSSVAARERAGRRARDAYVWALQRAGADASRAHFEIAEIDRTSGRYGDALAAYHRALERPGSPEVARALLGTARCEAALLRFARSRDALHRLLREPSVRELAPQALILLAESYLAEGRDADAEKSLRHLLDSFPSAGEAAGARLRLARIYVAQKKHEAALEEFRRVAEANDPAARAEAALGSARALRDLSRPSEAARELAAALRKGTSERSAEAFLLLADTLHAAGDHLAALFALKHLKKAFAGSREARTAEELFARETTELGLLEDAATALAAAPEGEAFGARAVELARAWLVSGEPWRARALIDRSPARDGASLVLLRARCDLAARDFAACLRTLAALDDRPISTAERADAARLGGDAALALGRPAVALRIYREGRIEEGSR